MAVTAEKKLTAVMKMLKFEFDAMKKALAEDGEYDSMDGNGINSSEALGAFGPIYLAAEKIVAWK